MFILIPCEESIKDTIENALIAGYTKTMIAKEYNICSQTIDRWLKGGKISARKRAEIGETELYKHYSGSKIIL